jgi:hypothetical protein
MWRSAISLRSLLKHEDEGASPKMAKRLSEILETAGQNANNN